MDRLGFELPEFTRTMWVSDRARDVWVEMEWLAVAAGVRRCCITFATPEDFLANGPKWATLGLNALPVEMQGMQNYSYPGPSTAYEPGNPFVFRFVLGSPRDVMEFHDAYQA